MSHDSPDGQSKLIRDLDLCVPAGRIIGLVGATGAGKSTISAMLTGQIAELPPLGEGCRSLSVGKRQRISIAWAIDRDPALLVVDAATSALDTISEAELTSAVQGLRGRTTVAVVAHRLSSARNCDLIYLIGAGGVLKQGSHDGWTGHKSQVHAFHRAGA
ncbi:ATP-binding cassette domain-containing protein [Salipiger mangrovisoli]|uniref:ATP-binding cassette domain-containing protein n=1 Tax=Salipiger mangrovisoli TaxID=2865933 RepID=A0ABR9X1E8_9RHOB|nr:ATP-binding cassette domain-containing protein [Salipiger mangrovisoli]